jgi:hypothetical protein
MKGRNNMYLSLQEKLTQYLSFIMIDDSTHSNSKLMLIDPYDYETLQIFFDADLDKMHNKIQVVDVVNKKTLDFDYCNNKFIINVESRRAITEPNYFMARIELCESNRIKELEAIGVSLDKSQLINIDFDKEVRRIPTDLYLEMTILPLLHSVIYFNPRH